MRSPRIVAPPALVVAVIGLAARGSGDTTNNTNPGTDRATDGGRVIQADPGNPFKPTISIGSKSFTEEFVLGEIYPQALQAAGNKIKKQLNLGSEQIALKAVQAERVDAYRYGVLRFRLSRLSVTGTPGSGRTA
jgi:hypothetical protein